MFNVPYKTSGGLSLIPIESWLISEGKLFIHGEITENTASEFVQKLMYLRKEKPDERIKVYVNSIGGNLNAGKLIYDAIKSQKSKIDIICTGMAASMAAIILAGGQKGRRYILPRSEVMIHEPFVEGGVGGSSDSIRRTAETLLRNKREAIELLAADTGKSAAEVEKAISYDHYMTAKEAIAFGICDKIIKDFV